MTESEEDLLQSVDQAIHDNATASSELPSDSDAAISETEMAEAADRIASEENEAIPPLENPSETETSDENLNGSPEEWTALAAVAALDGDGIADLDKWLTTATPDERDIYTRRIRIGHALLYTLDQKSPRVTVRDTLSIAIGATKANTRWKVFPQRHQSFTQYLAETLGWPQARLLKITTLLALGLAVAGWVLAWRGFRQAQYATQAAVHSESLRHESETARHLAETRLAFMASADLRMTTLQGKDSHTKAAAHLLWSPFGRRALLWVANLANPAEGQEIVLWVNSGSRQFAALRLSQIASHDEGHFFDVPSLQEGRPRPIQSFYLVLQTKGARDSEEGERLFTGNAY